MPRALVGLLVLSSTAFRGINSQARLPPEFAAATRVVVIGLDNNGETILETYVSESAEWSRGDDEDRRMSVLGGCLGSVGFKINNSSKNTLAAHGAGSMEIVGGTARDTIPGVVSVKGVVVLVILVGLALSIAIGLSKHLERISRGATGIGVASAATSTTTHGGRGYSQISPSTLSDSDTSDVENAGQCSASISSGDEEPRTPPLKDRFVERGRSSLAEAALEPAEPEPAPEQPTQSVRGQGRAEAEAEAKTSGARTADDYFVDHPENCQ